MGLYSGGGYIHGGGGTYIRGGGLIYGGITVFSVRIFCFALQCLHHESFQKALSPVFQFNILIIFLTKGIKSTLRTTDTLKSTFVTKQHKEFGSIGGLSAHKNEVPMKSRG